MLDEPTIQFTLDGTPRLLSRDQVERCLSGVEPEAGSKHFVEINSTWFPVQQALEAALNVPRSRFRSSSARRHLAALGFDLRGVRESRERQPLEQKLPEKPEASQPIGIAVDESWHTEENVQAAIVRSLVAEGWTILREANTATREHGIDIVAEGNGMVYGVEVKGYPSRGYADPRRAGETKRTSPSTQAGHWYSQAMLAAARLRSKQPDMQSVIALPNFPRYRTLFEQTHGSLEASGVQVWWVAPDGQVTKP